MNGNGFTAPYTSFATLLRLVERMAEEGGAPARIDRSYLSDLPASTQTVLIASCRTLGLIDRGRYPTRALRAMVDAPWERKSLMREIVRDLYHGPLSLEARATQGQLEEEFGRLNVSGSTMQKAIRFYLSALEFASIPHSPHFKVPKTAASKGSRSGRREELPRLVQGLIECLPTEGETLSAEEADRWLQTARLVLRLAYGYEGGDGSS